MRRMFVVCLSLLLAFFMVGCGDSGTTAKVNSIAYIHVTGVVANSTFHMRDQRNSAIRPSVSGTTYSINIMNVDGTNQQTLYTSDVYVAGVDLSRDGKKIAYIGYDSVSGYDQIYMLDVSTKQPTKLTSDAEYKYEAMLTPDGKNVVYRAYTGSYGAQLWSVPTTGGTAKLIATSDTICIHEPHISLDGKKVVFDFHDTTYSDALAIVNLDGSGYRVVPNTQGIYTPALSADNTKVFYSIWPDYAPQLYVMNVDGTNAKAMIQGGASIDPYPVGDKVLALWDTTAAYVDLDIYSMNADGSSPKKLTNGGLNFMQWTGD